MPPTRSRSEEQAKHPCMMLPSHVRRVNAPDDDPIAANQRVPLLDSFVRMVTSLRGRGRRLRGVTDSRRM
jgi:hypothetical protein